MKKQLSLILCVSILLSLLGGFSLVAYAVDSITIPYGDSTVTIKGLGTAESPYLIEDGNQFAAVFGTANTANHALLAAGKYYKQIADITLPGDYKPLAKADGSVWNSFWFQGTYEGDKKYRKIDFGTRNEHLNNFALIHSLGDKGVIRSIEVTGDIGNDTTAYSGGIAVNSYGAISGCKSSVNLKGQVALGGFVYLLQGTVDCSWFAGSVTASQGLAGGIAAVNDNVYVNNTAIGIYSSIVSGSVSGGSGYPVGGLISYIRNKKANYNGCKYRFNILNNMFIGTISTAHTRSGVICAGINTPGTSGNYKYDAAVTVNILSNLIASADFAGWTNDNGATHKIDRVFGFGSSPNYKNSNGSFANIAYYPAGATLYNIQKETLVTDINSLTGPNIPAELTNYNEWSYFPAGGNNDFKLPQITKNPFNGEVPEWLKKLFATAEAPAVTVENIKNVPTAVLAPAGNDTSLGFRVAISDSLGRELGVVASGSVNIPLSKYITEEGTYKIKVMALGGYQTCASEYGEEITFEYEITLPEALLTTNSVYTSAENEIYTDDNGWYRNFAVIASEAYPVEGYTVSSYGVLLNTSETIDLDNYTQKLDGKNASENGQFGILIHGKGIKAGTVYYARSFAVYADAEGNETKVYGNVQSFSL